MTHASATATSIVEPAPGTWLHNPVTGELARFGPPTDDGRRIEADLWLQPGAALARPHIHDHLSERFEVRAGTVGMQIAGRAGTARAGDAPVDVPAGNAHDWWNAGDGVANVHIDIAAAPSAPGRPAERFLAMIEAIWSLGALGRVDAKGAPKPLWLVAAAREYRDAIRLTSPPAVVQNLLLPPLAAFARRTGHDPRAPELHGPGAACAIQDPSEVTLNALLAKPVGARAARSHV